MPGDVWQRRAKAFLDRAIDALWSNNGKFTRAWLHTEKGLQDATIKMAGLGLNLVNKYEPRETWGLDLSFKEDGTERQWIPKGLVIPFLKGGAVHRLRVRRDDLGDDGPRYVAVSGSSMEPMILGPDRAAFVIVESELDALLLNQEVGDLAGVIALGSAQAKPDIEVDKVLKAAAVVLIALDNDEAGAKASWAFWPATYGDKVKRWPCVLGKDPSEARSKGLDLRQWIVAGMFGSEEKFERFCIQTVEGGLTDSEALATAGV
jgi:hypothetical protein